MSEALLVVGYSCGGILMLCGLVFLVCVIEVLVVRRK